MRFFIKSLVKRTRHIEKQCPFCHRKLDGLAFLKRRITKICKCSKCGRIIDERHIRWESV